MHNDEPPFDPYEDAVVTPIRNTPAHNHDAEQALLGALLLEPHQAHTLHNHLDPDDFYNPRHELIWTAIHHTAHTYGVPPEPALVLDHLTNTGNLQAAGGATYLHDLMAACHTPSAAPQHATLIRNAARARAITTTGTRLTQLAATATPDTLDRILDESLQTLDNAVARFGPRHQTAIRVPTIDDLLAATDDDYDWVIPGLLEHQERVILTAEEGAGKSTLLRQIAITAATGIHPFTGDPITPVRVLHIDVENSERQSRRRYRPLRAQAHNLDPDRLRIEIRVQGLDLTTGTDVTWLSHTVAAAQPDLIVIGPIYKLANGDPTEEASSKPVAMAIDRIRAESDAAVILEAHVAKATGVKKRPHEPYGWSGWMRWPEIGIYLDTDGKLTHWRGAREERTWPTELTRGGTWPWTAVPSDADRIWEQVRNARLRHGQPLGLRKLEEQLSISKSALDRVIGRAGPYGHIWPSFNNNQHPGEDRT